MKNWRVVFKKFSEIEKAFVWAEDVIQADRHQTHETGALEFWNREELIQTIPPGCWMGIEEQK